MKKLLFLALFLGSTTLAFAQATFTEKTIQDMNQHMVANALNFLTNEIDPTFTLVGAEGRILTYENFKGLYSYPGFKMDVWSVSDLKIKQFGKTTIATGIKTHSMSLHDTVMSSMVERFTYFYEFKNNKWMWTYGQHTPIFKPAAEEVEAVKKALVDERKAFYAGDKEGLTKLWTNNPATFINASYPSGRQFYRNSEAVKKSIEDFKPRDNVVGTITSSKVKLYGNNAIADLEVTANYKNGTVAKEHNIVLLEKEGDAWKILGYSTHGVAPDKKEDEAAIKTVLEKETTAWHARDGESMATCWANTEYALTAVYHGIMEKNNGVAYFPNPKKDRPEAIKAMVASMGKPDGSTFKNENYVMNISGASAFVHFHETTTAGDGSKRSDYQIRFLERIDGEWKIVYVGGIKH